MNAERLVLGLGDAVDSARLALDAVDACEWGADPEGDCAEAYGELVEPLRDLCDSVGVLLALLGLSGGADRHGG